MDGAGNFAFDPSKMSKFAADDYSSSDSDGSEDEYRMPSTDPSAGEFRDFNPRKRRRTGRDTKESAALGIFGSESEDEGPGRKWRKKTLRSKGVSFVSSGVQANDDNNPDDDEEDEEIEDFDAIKARVVEEEEDEDDDDDEEAGGVGLGFSASVSHGMGFAAPTQRQLFTSAPAPTQNIPKTKFNSSSPLSGGFIPSSAHEPILRVQNDVDSKPQVARPSAFSSKGGKKGKGGINAKSFGARMMAKMGYVEGEGLGKDGQGRNVIIEASLRPQGVGLGAVKEKTDKERHEEKRQAQLRGEVVVDSDEEEKKKKAAARRRKAMSSRTGSAGPGSGASTPKRQKAQYITMDEARKAAPGLNIPDAFTPILDLTGPGKKMLTSSSGLMTPTGGTPSESSEHAESRKIARRAQNDFMAILEEWQHLQNRKAYADLQMQQEKQELEELERTLKSHQSMTAAFAELPHIDGTDSWEHRWNHTLAQLKLLPEESAVNLKEDLGAITVAATHPLFKQAMASWNPLEEPNPPLAADLKSIQDLLGVQEDSKHHRKSAATPYGTMMYKIWLPHVSRAVRGWHVRDCDQLLSLYESWRPLLPTYVRTQLLEQDIVRKLEEALSKWEPKRRKQQSLPHTWLFPWLQYLPSHHLDPKASTGLVADVKRKFRQLIEVWDFYKGVIPGLRQWKEVLRPSKETDQWRPLVMNHVLPSMGRYVKAEFQVDPLDQEPYLEVITGEFQWLEIMSPSMIGEVMVAEMFPMWHEALYRQLTVENVDFDKLAQWFSWWAEEAFPEELRSLPSISAEFERGAMMINEALDLGRRAVTELEKPRKGAAHPAKQTPRQESNHKHHHQAPPRPAVAQPETEEMSIRTFAEDWCESNDLHFIPERKKVHAEGPLYRITARGDGRGGVLTYFKGIRLYAETKKGPVEIRADREADWTQLLELAQ